MIQIKTMKNIAKIILLKSRLSWRTLCLFWAITLEIAAQYSDNLYGNNPRYSPWNPPLPYDTNPHGSSVPYSVGRAGFEKYSDQNPFGRPEYLAEKNFDNNVFSTANKYEVVAPESESFGSGKSTPLYGGTIDGLIRLEKSKSPYLVQEDVIVERNGEIVIEPGVVVKFSPMVGLTIRGVLNIQVSVFAQIRLVEIYFSINS